MCFLLRGVSDAYFLVPPASHFIPDLDAGFKLQFSAFSASVGNAGAGTADPEAANCCATGSLFDPRRFLSLLEISFVTVEPPKQPNELAGVKVHAINIGHYERGQPSSLG
jgi:hypothetical protein